MGNGVYLALGVFANGAASAEAVRDHVLDSVDPELRAAAAAILEAQRRAPSLELSSLASLRQPIAAFNRIPQSEPAYSKVWVPAATSTPELDLYVINVKPEKKRPAILHMHGGGYFRGSALASVAALQPIAALMDCAIVSVEYRLAPETNFAGSVEDNVVALRWLIENDRKLGIDARRIVVMGESAGGGHASLLAFAARDRGLAELAGQVLIYPMLDDRTGSTRPAVGNTGNILWTARENRFGWRSFLGEEPGTSNVPRQAVPARRTDLAGLPPTFIAVGAIDLFVGEDIAFAQNLLGAGVPTELLVLPGAFHGFDGLVPDASLSRHLEASKRAALSRFFNGT